MVATGAMDGGMLGLAAGMVGLGPSDASLEGGAASGPAAVGEAAGELEQAARTPSKEVAISLRNTAPAPKLDGGSLAATFSTDRLRACCKAHPGGSRPGQRRRRAGSAHGQETIGGAAPIRRSRRLQDRPRGRARAVRIAGAGALPPAERLDARPRPRRRAGPAVHVQHARFDLVEELLDLARVLAVYARGEAVDRAVGKLERLVQ